jgi:diaminopimelate epimerase
MNTLPFTPKSLSPPICSTLLFEKVQANGNDFIAIYFPDELPDENHIELLQRQAPTLCHRSFGVGADGLILYTGDQTGGNVRFLNSDGSLPRMCGNGLLCTFFLLSNRFAQLKELTQEQLYPIQTDAGIHYAIMMEARTGFHPTVLLPAPSTSPQAIHLQELLPESQLDPIKVAFLTVGVPHLVILLRSKEALEDLEVNAIAPLFRYHEAFAPQGTNVNFVYYDHKSKEGKIRTYERGVEGETLACGTGCCASAIVLASLCLEERIYLDTRSGSIVTIQLPSKNAPSPYLYFSGRVGKVFSGEIAL